MSRKGMRARKRVHNKLQREGLTFKELKVGDDTGFVLRIMDGDTVPPKVTTIVQQPGHDRIATNSLLFATEPRYPYWGVKSRFAPAEPTETEGGARILELLETSNNPLAEIALRHLFTAEQMTKDRIQEYRAAAEGEIAIHTFSYEGEVRRSIIETSDTVRETIFHESNFETVDGQGHTIYLEYDGIMAPEQCTERADQLEASLLTGQPV